MQVFINDVVIAQVDSHVADAMIPANMSTVLLIYTGGTIGMQNTPQHGYLPVHNYLEKTLESSNRFHDGSLGLTNAVHVQCAKSSGTSTLINGLNIFKYR